MKELALADSGKMELPDKPILITFDDGYYSNYEYIYPIVFAYSYGAYTAETVRTLKNNGIDFQTYDIVM